MKYYKFNFTGDYHLDANGNHSIKLIERDVDGIETAYAASATIPDYGIEISAEETATLGIVQKVPEEISKYQAMQTMKNLGIWEDFKTLTQTNEEINDVWLTAPAIRRDYPMIAYTQAAFNITDEQMDDLFIEASTIR